MTFICPITDMDGAVIEVIPLKPAAGPCRIKNVVGVVFEIEPALLNSKRRCHLNIAQARQAAYLLYHEHTAFSYPQIARQFNRDHTTIMYGVKVARKLLETDEAFRRFYEECEATLFVEGVCKK